MLHLVITAVCLPHENVHASKVPEKLLHTLPPAQSESSPPDCGHFCWKHWKSPACWRLSWEAGLPALPHASQTARPLAGGKRCWRRCFLPDLRKNKEMLSTNHRTIKYFWIKMCSLDHDSHERGEVWEGSGFKQQREPGLHTVSVVGREGQRQRRHNPLVLRDKTERITQNPACTKNMQSEGK